MSNEQADVVKSFPFLFRFLKGNGLEQQLLRSHFVIASIGIALLIVSLISTLVLRSNAICLAQHRGPTARTSMLALSGANRSLAGLRGWIVLGEPRYLDDLTDAWQNDIHPAVSRLDELSMHWTNPQNLERLREVKATLNELETMQQEVAAIAQSPNNEPAQLLLEKSIQPVTDAVVSNITALINSEKTTPGGINARGCWDRWPTFEVRSRSAGSGWST